MDAIKGYHKQRREEILESYPQVRSLLRHEPKSIFLTLFLVTFQIILAVILSKIASIWFLILAAIFIGGPINFALLVLIHEMTHNTMSTSENINNITGLIANLTLLFPSAMSFKKYHLLHHRFLGVIKYDTDLPTQFEKKYLLSNFFGKLIWFLLQPLIYSFRPFIVLPMKLNRWEQINILIQFFFVILLYSLAGFLPILYMLIAFYISLTCSPYFARYITEHYVRDLRQETSSYYGILNPSILNFGYHVEHHDFPTMPWNNLTKLHKIANIYYKDLDSFNSWTMVIIDFFSPSFNERYHRVINKND